MNENCWSFFIEYDYYPFGMVMPERNYQANIYNYGYNGKPKDDEFHNVTGTFYDYGFRVYDSRLCRFLSVDPLTKDYPSLTSYQFASNRPIDGVDLDGLEYLYYALDFVDGNLVYKYLGTQKERIVTVRALGLVPIDVPVWLPKRFVLQLNESGPHFQFSSFKEMNDAVMSGKSLDMNQTLEADIQFENDLQYVTGTIGAAMVSYMASGLGAKETSVSARNRTLMQEGLISEEIGAASKATFTAKGVKLPTKINVGDQGKHIVGNIKYNSELGKSILDADAQTLLNGVNSGRYKILRTHQNNVIVDFEENIGTFFQNGKAVGPTRFGTVHYGQNGAHIVPANPIQY